MAFKGITAFVLGNNGEGGGGGGGTTNYNDLTNHPQINGNELTGNKTADQLGLLPADTDIPTKLSDLDEDVTHRTVTDLEKQSWNNKVDSVAGKGLSTNDYTDEDKTALANKVDKVTGKGLSTNDYTDGEKEDVAQIDGLVGTVGSLSSAVGIVSSKVGTLEGEMLSVQDALDTKVDKETGKGLSTNDYTNADKAIVDGVTTALAGKVDTSSVGTANGVAGLDNTGRVPSSQLPSYVDDVLEYASLSAFPETGEGGKIYIALDTNKTYRWSGSAYVEISESLALGETQGTAYEGNKGKANADAIDVLETTVEAIPEQIETVVKDTVGFVGKNLCNPYTFVQGLISHETGIIDSGNMNWISSDYIPCSGKVTISGWKDGNESNFSVRFSEYDSSKNFIKDTVNVNISTDAYYSRAITLNSNTRFVRITQGFDTKACTPSTFFAVNRVQIEKGSTATSYEPYHETVQEMFDSLGESAYKDSISVVTDSSDLVESGAVYDALGFGNKNIFDVEKNVQKTSNVMAILDNSTGKVYLTKSGNWKYQGISYYIFDMFSEDTKVKISFDVIAEQTTKLRSVIGSRRKSDNIFNETITGSELTVGHHEKEFTVNSNLYFSILVNGNTTEEGYLYLDNMMISYDGGAFEPYHESVSDSLAEKADNSVIGTVEDGATASKDYAVGDYFIKDTILGKTKAAIASGGTFTKDTNYEETNVAKEITELYKYIGILTTPVEAFTANSLPILKRNITNAFYNGSLRGEIAAGNFKNVRPGDYIIGQATGSTYYVAECDYWLGNGDSTNGTTYPAYNTHHLGLMLFKPVGTTALWRGYGYSDKSWRVSAADLGRCPWNAETTVDPTDTEAIGSNSTNITRSYNGTNMSAYMGSFIRERIDAILLPQCFQADFGSANVLKRRNWLSNAINASAASGARSDWQGIASGSVWVDRFIDLASEVELYGSRINSSSRDDIGVQNKQLPIYRNGRIHDFYPRMDLWTKGIASATSAALRYYYGTANTGNASNAFWACPLGCVK